VRFSFDDVVLSSKLIDGTFPDYERVIPQGNDKVLEVDCKTFAEAVDRVATISTEKSRAVKLSLNNGTLVLSATSPDAGSATEELEVNYKSSLHDGGLGLADHRARPRRPERALRPDADAGVRDFDGAKPAAVRFPGSPHPACARARGG
jgi:hypothetical protein